MYVSLCVYRTSVISLLCVRHSFFPCQSPFPLFPCLLAAYLPPTKHANPCKHTYTLQLRILKHTHHLQFTVLRMVDGRRGSACSGCQTSQCREDILVNELQKYSSHLVSTSCVYVCMSERRKEGEIGEKVNIILLFPLMSLSHCVLPPHTPRLLFLLFKLYSLVDKRKVGGLSLVASQPAPACLDICR